VNEEGKVVRGPSEDKEFKEDEKSYKDYKNGTRRLSFFVAQSGPEMVYCFKDAHLCPHGVMDWEAIKNIF
jgi:hypothetical protein